MQLEGESVNLQDGRAARLGPGDFTLYAYVKDMKGQERDVTLAPPVDELDPDEGNLRGLVHHVVR